MFYRFPDLNGCDDNVYLQSEDLTGTDHFKWEDNVAMNLEENEHEALNLIPLCQNRVWWQYLPKASGSIKGG
jgi:sulfur transfer protein SufE